MQYIIEMEQLWYCA